MASTDPLQPNRPTARRGCMTDYSECDSKKTSSDRTATSYRLRGALHRPDGRAVDSHLAIPRWFLMGVTTTRWEPRRRVRYSCTPEGRHVSAASEEEQVSQVVSTRSAYKASRRRTTPRPPPPRSPSMASSSTGTRARSTGTMVLLSLDLATRSGTSMGC